MTNIMIAILCFSLAILGFVMAALDLTIPGKLDKFAGYFCVLAGIVCVYLVVLLILQYL